MKALCLSAALLPSLFTFSATPLTAQQPTPQNGFAAKVNGEAITLAELVQLIDRRLEPNFGRVPDSLIEQERERLKPVVLRELIERRLMVQQAKREGIILHDGAIDDYLQKTVDRMSRVEGTRFSIDDYVFLWKQQFGESEDQLRKNLGDEILIKELKNQKLKIAPIISPRQLRSYYRDNVDDFSQDGSVKFRQLLVSISDQDHSKIIKQIDQDLASGEALPTLIKKYSSGPRSEDGGLYQMKDSQLDDRFPPVPEVVRGLAVGQSSDWFVCRGYSHKILLEERIHGGPLNFEEAQGQIRLILREKLLEKQHQKFERQLWKKAKIQVFIPGIEISGAI